MMQTPTHALPNIATDCSSTAQRYAPIPVMTNRKPEMAKIVHTLWHLFNRRIKAFAFFSSSALGLPSGLAMHENSPLESNNETRLRSILSKGGSSRRVVNEFESVENNGGHPTRNGVVDKDVLWW